MKEEEKNSEAIDFPQTAQNQVETLPEVLIATRMQVKMQHFSGPIPPPALIFPQKLPQNLPNLPLLLQILTQSTTKRKTEERRSKTLTT